MTHSYHPDVYEAGLHRGCPRCEELADLPDQLDPEMQAIVLHRPRNALEVQAQRNLKRLLFERLVLGACR